VTEVVRPIMCPPPGHVPSFDAGWDAHEVGLGRGSVEILSPDPGWALLGWDARHLMEGVVNVNRMFEEGPT
jgi:hypothetical protein